MKYRNVLVPLAVAAWIAGAQSALALEYPMGTPQDRDGMKIGSVYLQPVTMEPAAMMRPASESDVHMEADIHALANDPNGFPRGSWIPALLVRYRLSKTGSRWTAAGEFMPMVANDGPHYGDNIKLDGPGRYRVVYTIYPPDAPGNPYGHNFGRHTDRLTGVHPWFKPFSVEFEFVYAGIGKKGGY